MEQNIHYGSNISSKKVIVEYSFSYYFTHKALYSQYISVQSQYTSVHLSLQEKKQTNINHNKPTAELKYSQISSWSTLAQFFEQGSTASS